MRIKEEIRRRPACWVGRIPILNCMCIEKLASVVCAISRLLEPDREIVLVKALGNELWVSAYSND